MSEQSALDQTWRILDKTLYFVLLSKQSKVHLHSRISASWRMRFATAFSALRALKAVAIPPSITKTDDAMEPVTPSKTTTSGQIDQAVARYRTLLEKHSREFDSATVQVVLGQPEFASEQFEVFRRRVEELSEMIVRRVKVPRGSSPQEVLNLNGDRPQYTTERVVEEMPRVEWEEVEVCFFPIKRTMTCDQFQEALALRGLVPDPYAQSVVNAEDPAFADKQPNGTQWKNGRGEYCYAAFRRWGGERRLRVDQRSFDWNDGWWACGSRKVSS